MSDYRRVHVPGGTYFFTVRLQDRRADLLVSHIGLLRDATRVCRKRWPFEIDAAVILPNKLHMIWTLPDGDTDFSKRWRTIKSGFSRHVPAPGDSPKSRRSGGQNGIWQRGFWEHLIRDADDLALHMHLIRSAPLHAGLVKRPSDWPYCSLHRQVNQVVRTTVPALSDPNPEAVVIST